MHVLLQDIGNIVVQLKDKDGSWCSDNDKLKTLALDFFQHLYTKDPSVVCNSKEWNFSKLNWNSIWWMNREVTEYEIKLDTFQMGANKVVGRDGSPANFFQK